MGFDTSVFRQIYYDPSMDQFMCKRGHVTTLPKFQRSQQSVEFTAKATNTPASKSSRPKSIQRAMETSPESTAKATNTATETVVSIQDMGIDTDADGKKYISCGWVSDDEGDTPDDIGAPHALSIVRGTIKTSDTENWYCTEKAYQL